MAQITIQLGHVNEDDVPYTLPQKILVMLDFDNTEGALLRGTEYDVESPEKLQKEYEDDIVPFVLAASKELGLEIVFDDSVDELIEEDAEFEFIKDL